MYLGFLLKHNGYAERVQEGAEEEGSEEAPGILENTGGCVWYLTDILGTSWQGPSA